MPSLTRYLFLVLVAWPIFLLSQDSRFKHFTVNNGLANSMVYYAMQDSKGYMWFCTESGVNRFDGTHFETFTIQNGLADNENFRCIEDSKGRIWFASYNGQLSYYNGREFINERNDTSLKQISSVHKHIEDIIEDPKGNIWFSKHSESNIYKYDGKKLELFEARPSSWGDKTYLKFFFNYQGHVNYLNYTASGFLREDPETNNSHKIIGTQGSAHTVILPRKLQLDSGLFYYTDALGLMKFNNDSINPVPVNYRFQLAYSPVVNLIVTTNEAWLIANCDGILRFKDYKNTRFNGSCEHFLKGLCLSHITKDSEGGIWMTTLSDGVFYLPPAAEFITNIAGKGIASAGYNRHNGLVGFGTFDGKFFLLEHDSLTLRYEFKNPENGRIKILKWQSPTRILLGNHQGPYDYDLISSTQATLTLNEPYLGCADVDEGEAGIWLLLRHKIVLMQGNTTQVIYGKNDSRTEKLISIAGDGKKGCWFTGIQNLYWLALESKKPKLIAGNSLFNSNLKDLGLANNLLWVATDGNGIFVFKDGKLLKHIYSANTTLTSDVCQKLVYDGKGKMWVATNKGITVLDALTFKYLYSFTTNDNLINNDVKDIDVFNDKAYVATPAGVSVIDVSKMTGKAQPPVLHLKNIVVKDTIYALADQPRFYYQRGVLKLSYTGITFQSKTSLRYRYKFAREGSEWNETPSDQLEFYDLEPGEYSLLICAKKYNSEWCEPVLAKFTILPLRYQTIWLKLLVVALLICALAIITGLVIKTKKRNVETEKQILQGELRAIRLQMNPHFIFNTLNSLQLFIFQNKSIEANAYIAKFSRLIRWIMAYSEKQEITLEEEIEFLKTYVALEQLRFDESLKVEFSTDPSLPPQHTYIPPLIVQPFVENAIKYGLAEKKEGGLLKISYQKTGSLVFVTVEDNGVGRDKVRQDQAQSVNKPPSKGIKYTEERLQLLLRGLNVKDAVKITDLYADGIATGTKVEIYLPILNEKD